MKRKVSAALLIFLTPIVLLSHVGWSQKDNGLMFNVDGREVDFLGIIQDKWRKTSTSCREVTERPTSDPAQRKLKELIQSYSPPDSTAIKNIHIWSSGTWAVAEVEFESLLPAVVTIKNIDKDAEIIGDAIWSGMTAPWKPGPFIRAYLRQRSGEVPESLLNCFELQTESFKH
jgi:hypothetical protein